jgi:hypothetical protein
MNVKPQDKMTIRLLNSYQGIGPRPLCIKVENKAKASRFSKDAHLSVYGFVCVSANLS